MDIRKFFGKADGKKKPVSKKKPSAANAATVSTPQSAPTAPKRKENDDREETEILSSQSDPSPPKKQKSTEDRVEISKEAFFGQASERKQKASEPPKKQEEWVDLSKEESGKRSPEPTWVEVSKEDASGDTTESKPEATVSDSASTSQEGDIDSKKESPKQLSQKKRRLIIEDDDDDDDDSDDEVAPRKPSPMSKKAKRVFIEDDDHEDEEYVQDEGNESPKAKKETPKKSPKKSPKRPTSSKGKSKKEEHKESLIQPDLKLSSFSTDEAVPECLSGTTFVFSGILEDLSREAAEDLIKTLGGRVTSAVSGKTDYLVVGDVLEDGRPYTQGSKYKKAIEGEVIVVKGEEQLYGLVKLYNDRAKAGTPSKTAAAKPAAAQMPSNPYAKRPVNPYAANPSAKSAAKPSGSVNPYGAKSVSPAKVPAVPTVKFDPMSLWADRYAPQTTRDILGNQENVKKLTTCKCSVLLFFMNSDCLLTLLLMFTGLNRWEDVFNTPKAQGKTFSSPNGPWKAALLSGPPGIGKTTSATLVGKESGRDVLELNASDARSKKALSEGMGDLTGSQVLNFKVGGSKTAPKRCIIMDEVDGMGAGDRSGMAELIKMIKGSKVPIICICNDRQSQKIKSLAPYCLDLRFRRPVKSVIARRAVEIGQQEGMRIEMNAAEAIAESCGNDIRQVLNCLQMWSSKEGASMSYKDLKDRQASINKDEILRVTMFDATKLICEGRRGLSGADAKAERDSLYKRSDAFFVDYSFMGLMVHQNYPKVLMGQYTEAKRANDEGRNLAFLEQMYDATAAMSDYAVAEHAVRSGDQNWSLLPFSAMMTVKAGYHAGGEHGGFLSSFPEFTAWMGKNSSRGKKTRLLQELNHHMNYKISGGYQELRMSYLPVLRERFASLLTADDGAKTEEAIHLMDEYGLDRDDVFENIDEFKMDPKAKPFASILDSKQKAAFTRAYNAGSHKSQALVDEQGGGKTVRRKQSSSNLDSVDPDIIDDDKQEESDDEFDEEEAEKAMELFKKKGAKKAAKKNDGKGKNK